MGNWEFYDENDEVEGIEDNEPSFSIYEFKKWLDSQGEDGIPRFKEDFTNKQSEDGGKDEMKEKFKQRMRERVQKKVNKKLEDKKKGK